MSLFPLAEKEPRLQIGTNVPVSRVAQGIILFQVDNLAFELFNIAAREFVCM
jgi:hypothetical protein